jgi:hypothetical protein
VFPAVDQPGDNRVSALTGVVSLASRILGRKRLSVGPKGHNSVL